VGCFVSSGFVVVVAERRRVLRLGGRFSVSVIPERSQVKLESCS
jgi:hypothetical protein